MGTPCCHKGQAPRTSGCGSASRSTSTTFWGPSTGWLRRLWGRPSVAARATADRTQLSSLDVAFLDERWMRFLPGPHRHLQAELANECAVATEEVLEAAHQLSARHTSLHHIE